MVLNKYVVIYFLFLLISLSVGGLAAGTGWWVYFRSHGINTHEARRHLEKYL